MTVENARPTLSLWTKGAAILALVFGVMTIVSGGSVLFGADAMRAQAGDVVPFVLWFNLFAGFAYVTAGVGIWMRARWAFALSIAIALSTLGIAVAFTIVAVSGTAFEMRTVGALILRFAIWAGISILIRPRRA